jgi:hypothetical protein
VKRIFIILLVLMLIPAIAFCSTTKVIDQDMALHPQGWPYGVLTFKGGTQVTLNENGEVITGVMRNNEELIVVGSVSFGRNFSEEKEFYLIYFKGDTITFNEKGEVISGTIGSWCFAQLIRNSGAYVKFQPNTVLAFNSDGSVKQGTLARDYDLRPTGWRNFLPLDNNAGFIKFKEGTEVIFGVSAQVIKGTIANDLTVNGIKYPAGTILQFSDSANPQKI